MKKTIAILLSLVLLLGLCACGSGGSQSVEAGKGSSASLTPAEPTPAPTPAPTPEPTPALPDMSGVYRLTDVVAAAEDAEDETVAMFALLDALGIRVFLVVEDGGSAYLDVLDEQTPLRWDADGVYMSDEDGKELALDYAFAGNTLTVTSDDGSIVFTLLEGEELADYEENGSGGEIDWSFGYDSEPIPEGEPSAGPVSGVINGCTVTALGAETLQDEDGEDVLRVYWEFVNETDEVQSPSDLFYVETSQDGEALENGFLYGDDAVPEDDYGYTFILPGKTLRWTTTFLYDPEGGTIGLRISEWFEDEALLYYVDPAAPLGAPEDSFAMEIDPVIPEAFRSLPDALEDVTPGEVSFTPDYCGNPLLRVSFTFTNTTGEETSFYSQHSYRAYQDGYELETGSPEDWLDSDGALFDDIAPGESIECSCTFLLRTDSPVAVLIWNDSAKDEPAGLVVDEVAIPVAGVYRLESIDGYTAEAYADALEISVEEFGDLIVLTLFRNGDANWHEVDEDTEMYWFLEDEELSLYMEDDDEFELIGELSDGEIVFNVDGTEFVLVQMSFS